MRESLGNYDQNSFVQFLLNLFPDCPAEVWTTVNSYFLGTLDNKVVFWQIDAKRRIRTGKIMLYSEAGRRIAETYIDHNGQPQEIKTNWIHAQLKRRKMIGEGFNLKQCFFGEHLTADDSKPVAICEAEKTAVIASICFPEFVWIAAGGKQNLNAEKLHRFKDRQIILYPDADGFEAWQKIAAEANAGGLSVKVSALIESRATNEQKTNGYDLADYLINEQNDINERNLFADNYNAAVNRILEMPNLQDEFFIILDEQVSILEFDGNYSREQAERTATAPENLRQIVQNYFWR